MAGESDAVKVRGGRAEPRRCRLCAGRRSPGRDDDRVEKVVADFPLEPMEVSQLRVFRGRGELDLDRHDPIVGELDDQVDLVVPGEGA